MFLKETIIVSYYCNQIPVDVYQLKTSLITKKYYVIRQEGSSVHLFCHKNKNTGETYWFTVPGGRTIQGEEIGCLIDQYYKGLSRA